MSNISLSSAQTEQQYVEPSTDINPLAQSFIIDSPGGAFVTSLDLYFQAKDTTAPVTVEIRTMENGIPTKVIVPFSTVSVAPANVVVSSNASLATKFTFQAPIFLLDTAEYCFVVTSNSRSYLLWVAQIGGRDITNTAFSITKQPYSGVMFRAQNAGTWNPDRNFDIKFKLNRAEFVSNGNLILNESNIPAVTLDSNPFLTYVTDFSSIFTTYVGTNETGDNNYVIVKGLTDAPSGLAVNDQITISNETGTLAAMNGHYVVTEVNDTTSPYYFKFLLNVTTSPLTNGVPYAKTTNATIVKGSKVIRVFHKDHGHFGSNISKVTIDGVENAVNGIPIGEINKEHDIISVEQDSYTIAVATTAAYSAGRSGGSTVTATENRVFDTLYTNIQQIEFQNTACLWSMRTTTGKSLAGIETPHILTAYSPVQVNTNMNMTNPMVVKSSSTSYLGSKSFFLKGELSTNIPTLSPVIDLNRASLVTVNNRLDNPSATAVSGYNTVENYKAETSATGSSALSKYITRRIDLNTAAYALRIYVSINRPAGSNVLVYYKALTPNVGSDANFDSLGWNIVNPNTNIPVTANPKEYTEIEYDVTESMLQSPFTAFAVKIVFTSTNSSAVPTCSDFRAIAVT